LPITRTIAPAAPEKIHKPSGVHPALQARSKRTRDDILNAVKRALDDGVLETATVQDIATLAGVSIGAFYGRFNSKDTALAALYNEQRAEYIRKLTKLNNEAKSLDIWATQAVRLAIAYAAANRTLIARAVRPDAVVENVKEAAVKDSTAFAENLAVTLQRLEPGFPEEMLQSTAGFVLAMLGGMTRDAAVFSSALLGEDATRPWFEQNLAAAIKSFIYSNMATSA